MLDLGTIIALTGLAKDVYDTISGIRKVDHTPQVVKQLEALNTKFEKLGDHILYALSIQPVRDTSKNKQHIVTDLREVRQYLEPVQQAVGGDILSSAMILTPELMQQLIRKNPWQVLIDIRPVNLTTPHSNPDMVPILFDHEGMPYIGWQLRGTLPLLFNCQYDADLRLLKPLVADSFHPKLKNKLSQKSAGSVQQENIDNLDSLYLANVIKPADSRPIDGFTVSRNRSILALYDSNRVRLRSIEQGQLICELEHSGLQGCIFSPTDTFIVTWSKDALRLWHIESNSLVCTIENGPYAIDKILFSPDEKFLLVGTNGALIQLYSLKNGQCLRDLVGAVTLVDFILGSNDIIALEMERKKADKLYRDVELWKIADGFEFLRRPQFSHFIRPSSSISETIDGEYHQLITIVLSPFTPYMVDLRTDKGLLFLLNERWNFDYESDLSLPSYFAFPTHTTNHKLAYISEGRVKVLHTNNAEKTLPSQSGQALMATYSPNSKFIAVQFSDRCIRIYSSKNNAVLRTLAENGTIIGFTRYMLITGLPKVEGHYLEEWKIWQVS